MSTETPMQSESENRASTTPGEADDADSEQSDAIVGTWEEIGRELLCARLERIREETVRDAFRQATSRISDGDELTEDDIDAMYRAIQEAKRATEMAAGTSPETAPFPDRWGFLNEDGREAYLEEVERRRGH
ncbi:hypothetical protein [Halarchaeum grantii]|nr:hypothetical protein [Halarchaeum grantii]